MEHLAIPAWVHDLPLGAKIAAIAIGVPLLAVVVNVLSQLVSRASEVWASNAPQASRK